MAAFTVSVEKRSENDLEAVLATFCCYDYGANASETVKMIAIDKKDYHKYYLCVMVCCIVSACWRYKPDFYFFRT